jgi:hypothetical protein
LHLSLRDISSVIASEAKQSIAATERKVDCFVAYAPRNDGIKTCADRWQLPVATLTVVASGAKQSIASTMKVWIASSLRSGQ